MITNTTEVEYPNTNKSGARWLDITISIPVNLAYIKSKLYKTLDYWSRDIPNSDILEKGLE